MLGALLLSVLLCLFIFLLFRFGFPPASPLQQSPTAVLVVIPAPSLTPTHVQPIVDITPTAVNYAPLPEEEIIVGDKIRISGTDDKGLRIRKDPGLGGQVLFIASEAEMFQVTDGPVELDGYTWWYLVGVDDPTRKGWAVANYLTVIPEQ